MILDTHAWIFYATGQRLEKRAVRRIERALENAEALGLDVIEI